MIKTVNIESDDLKFSTMMITVTFNTVLAPDISRDMESLSGIDTSP